MLMWTLVAYIITSVLLSFTDTAAGNNVTDGCPTTTIVLREQRGLVKSPGYGTPYGYPGNSRCRWRIVAEKGKVVNVTFEDFSLEPDYSCRYDRVQVYDGSWTSAPLLAVYCSEYLDRWHLTSSGNSLLITFTSDPSMNFAGFMFSYRMVNQSKSVKRGCGRPSVQPLGVAGLRVVGGDSARPHSWPWQVGIKRSVYDLIFYCGASLISRKWVLTAAHCLYQRNWVPLIRTKLRVHVGAHYLFARGRSQVVHQVKRMVVHPRFVRGVKGYDIGLLELWHPVGFRDEVSPVCLPGINDTIPPWTICFATGWGLTKGQGSMLQLNQVGIPMLKDDYCSKPSIYGSLFKNDMMCAGYLRGGRDTCGGDSGGPLVCLTDGRWKQVGVTSWGSGCGKRNYPGVYTKVSYFLEWIKTYVKDIQD